MKGRAARGFTLLETVVALAILALALMAIFDLNAGAVSNHAYTKKLTVATLLARAKMTDLEQELHDEGFSNDDDEESGDFSEEGWSQFKCGAPASSRPRRRACPRSRW
jgi:general secretion pathway protein I